MVVQMSVTWDFLPVFIQLISQLKCSARQVLLCYYDMIRKGRIMHLFSTFKNQPYVKHRKPYVLPRTGSQPFWREGFTFLTAIIFLEETVWSALTWPALLTIQLNLVSLYATFLPNFTSHTWLPTSLVFELSALPQHTAHAVRRLPSTDLYWPCFVPSSLKLLLLWKGCSLGYEIL